MSWSPKVYLRAPVLLRHMRHICCTFTASCVVVVRPKTPMCGCGCGCGYWQFGQDMCGCGCGWQKWKVNNTGRHPPRPLATLAAPPPPQFADSPPDEVGVSLPANFSLADPPAYPPSCLVWDLSELKSFYFCFRRRTCPWRWRIESRGSRPVLL